VVDVDDVVVRAELGEAGEHVEVHPHHLAVAAPQARGHGQEEQHEDDPGAHRRRTVAGAIDAAKRAQ
jgi:hypothetical protein